MLVRLKNIINLSTELLILGIFFLVPLFFALFLKTNNVFELNKIILFKILVLILFLLSLAQGKIKKIFKLDKKLFYPALFFLSLSLINFFLGKSDSAFYGLYDRQQGLSSLFFYIFFFYLLLVNIEHKEQIKRIFFTISLSSFFVCLYGLAQVVGLDPLAWSELDGLIATSTFGQPNFLAAWLVLVLPISIYFFRESNKFFIRFFFFLVIASQLLCLFFTYSRGAWLGLLITVFLYFLLCLFKQKKNNLKELFLNYYKIFIIAFLLFSFLFTYFFISYVKAEGQPDFNIKLEKRPSWTEILKAKLTLDLKFGSLAARINIWEASIDAIKKQPFLGYGLESQGEVLRPYYQVDWGVYSKINTSPNRAHCLFLDILLTSGFLGLILYLVLFFLFFYISFDNIKKDKHRALSWTLVFGTFAYLLSLLFSFAVVATDIYFWAFFALIASLAGIKEKEVTEKTEAEKQKNFFWIKFLFFITVTLGVFWQVDKQFNYLIADHYFREIRLAFINKEYFQSYLLFEYLKETGVKERYYEKNFALFLADSLDDFKEEALLRPGREILREVLFTTKGEANIDNLVRAKIYSALASENETEYFLEAEKYFKIIISRSLERSQPYYDLANFYYKQGEYSQAVKELALCLSKLPDLDHPYINWVHQVEVRKWLNLVYSLLGDIYFAENDLNLAENYYQLALENNVNDIRLFKKIADVYYQRGDLNPAIWYNKRGVMREPDNYFWYFNIALLNKIKGDDISSREYAEKALTLSPENPKIVEFLREFDFVKNDKK